MQNVVLVLQTILKENLMHSDNNINEKGDHSLVIYSNLNKSKETMDFNNSLRIDSNIIVSKSTLNLQAHETVTFSINTRSNLSNLSRITNQKAESSADTFDDNIFI